MHVDDVRASANKGACCSKIRSEVVLVKQAEVTRNFRKTYPRVLAINHNYFLGTLQMKTSWCQFPARMIYYFSLVRSR